jgi:hypothetical protein
VDADVRALPQTRAPALAGGADPRGGGDTADLDVGREADAEVTPLLSRLCLARPEVVVPEQLDCPRQRLVVLAAVILEAREDPDGVVRKRVGRNEIGPPNRDRVEVELAGDEVHRTLDDVRRLRPAGTAVGVDHAGVRVDAGDLAVDVRDPVGTGQHPPVEGRWDSRRNRRQDPAEVRVRLRLQRSDRPVSLRADLEVGDVVAPVGRRDVVLAAALDPLDGAAGLLGECHDQHVFRVHEDLRAERAADLGRDATQLRLGNAQHERGHHKPQDVRRLRRHPQRVGTSRRIVLGDGTATFDRRRQQALVDKPLLDDDLGFGESPVRRLGIAALPLHDDVARRDLVELRRAFGHGALRVDYGLDRLPVNVDQRQRVLGRSACLGDNGRDAGARERDAVDLEDARRGDEVLDAGCLPRARQRRKLLEVLAGVDGDDARMSGRPGRVDAVDSCMRVWRAKDRHVRHSRQLQIVYVLRRARDQARVLDTLEARTDDVGPCLGDLCGHASPPGRRVGGRLLDGLDDVLVARAAA